MSRRTCPAATVWPEISPHGARLACCLPEGHDGDHLCADIEYLPAPAKEDQRCPPMR